MDRHRQFVEKLASRKLMGFRRMIDEDGEYYDAIYRSNASLTENIAIDYRGRFRRQSFWFQRLRKLSEYLAHLVDSIMRRVCGVASVAFRVFCV